jgi:hypothetical protein
MREVAAQAQLQSHEAEKVSTPLTLQLLRAQQTVTTVLRICT